MNNTEHKNAWQQNDHPLKLRAAALLALLAWISIYLVGCASLDRTAALVPDGSPSFALMDFSNPPSIDPPSPGWHHQTFLRHAPMNIAFVTKDGLPAIRLSTNNSASMLFRSVDVDLKRYPVLSWNWFIEQPIESNKNEMTFAGDDHPARLFLRFESALGKAHSMEIIWGNNALRRGDWKHLKFFGLFSFPHYTANGGDDNAGRWHREHVNMSELYTTLWGDADGARLVDIALFCDTDQTGAKSIAYFADIRAEALP